MLVNFLGISGLVALSVITSWHCKYYLVWNNKKMLLLCFLLLTSVEMFVLVHYSYKAIVSRYKVVDRIQKTR